jgi:plasmid stability protein
MKAITIRGVEPEVAQKLKQTATNQGKSVNQLVLEILKKNLGFEKGKKYSKNTVIWITCSENGVRKNLKESVAR